MLNLLETIESYGKIQGTHHARHKLGHSRKFDISQRGRGKGRQPQIIALKIFAIIKMRITSCERLLYNC